jgi:hypothetical protein
LLLTIISIQVNPRSYKVEVITYCLIGQERQAGILKIIKTVNQSKKKTS